MSLPKETMDILEALAPELTMSEDEMMIYELQGFLSSYGSDYFGTGEWQKFDDWLEKQKEQKPKFYPGDVIKCTSTGSLWVRCKDGDNIRSDGHTACIGGGYELASKEEAVQFFQELNENGYQWDCIKGRPMKKEQKPVEFPTTDEEVKEFLETHPKVEVPEKYKTPDFVFKKQEYESHPIISKDTTSVKPAEWNEDYNEENIQTRFAFYTYKDEPSTLYLSNVFVEESSRNHGFGTRILKAAEKVAEAIGAITISLKVKQNSPANAWYRKSGYGYVSFEDGYDWLEKNLEYMKPNKQEWSEEDADMLNCCISSIEEAKENRYAYKETDGDTSYDREIDWLKSLRPSKDCSSCAKHLEGYISGRIDAENKLLEQFGALVTPEDELHIKPRWKPSKEQMDALNEIINTLAASKHPHESDYLFNMLNGLRKNLKKL